VHESVRPLEGRDREAARGILTRAGNFTRDEIDTALELIDAWVVEGESSEYFTYVLEDADPPQVRGFVCFGPAPLTDGTFDLYWIAVDSVFQGHGYGRRLLRFAEDDVRRRGGRLLLIETSSQEAYGATTRFYERSGYGVVARIPEFYRAGDDKLIFAKRVEAAG
jgi:ribosomal protein S18 acetylase RimI-like enzyme